MIAVTGANGQSRATRNRGIVRASARESDYCNCTQPRKGFPPSKLGVQVREADYSRPETLSTALRGAERVLLISVDGSVRDSDCTRQ